MWCAQVARIWYRWLPRRGEPFLKGWFYEVLKRHPLGVFIPPGAPLERFCSRSRSAGEEGGVPRARHCATTLLAR
jgi:hypothetical protein